MAVKYCLPFPIKANVIVMQIDQGFADKMVEESIDECAEEHFAGDARRARKTLLRGECEYCKCVSNNLVRQIGKYLGQVDSTVKAVYQFKPAEDSNVSEEERSRGVHFLVCVEHKSAALGALAETLEAALAVSQRKLGCPKAGPECYILNMETVDDRDTPESTPNNCVRLINVDSFRPGHHLDLFMDDEGGQVWSDPIKLDTKEALR